MGSDEKWVLGDERIHKQQRPVTWPRETTCMLGNIYQIQNCIGDLLYGTEGPLGSFWMCRSVAAKTVHLPPPFRNRQSPVMLLCWNEAVTKYFIPVKMSFYVHKEAAIRLAQIMLYSGGGVLTPWAPCALEGVAFTKLSGNLFCTIPKVRRWNCTTSWFHKYAKLRLV